MFIHIGEGNIVKSEEVVAIIDCELLSSSTITEEMVFNRRKEKQVVETEGYEPKAMVVTEEVLYFSPLSVATLKKRGKMQNTLDKLDDYSEEMEEALDK
ncbi:MULTISPECIES: extracellular matrix regulator RemB [Salimicrobium]|uniref:DUF370 domain-containing protein n=2 Tax=Salimicrobium TaxID=351195 RepID=A0ABY1KY17_9BACI|nr:MULTISPECIES: DUF370 domain-containing protein [Salimicrobium]SDY34293.1 protein of unknown function [Salimicrobium album]SIS91707.1 protein of unknown function [Salimicrobium salexigens]